MRVDLFELLQTREIAHPTRFVAVQTGLGGDLRITVNGYPWWMDPPEDKSDRTITFDFEGISDGLFGAGLFTPTSEAEDLDPFVVERLSDLAWSAGPHCHVYTHAPTPDAGSIILAFTDYLVATDCPVAARRFLTYADSLADFVTRQAMQSGSFCSGPKGVTDFVCARLFAQAVPFVVIEGNAPSSTGYAVRLKDSRFICRTAFATFD